MNNICADFPMLVAQPNLIYLDNAASSQTPQVVLSAMNEYYTTKRANVHRGVYKASEDATVAYENARDLVARFLHAAHREEVIFTRGTTDSLNMLSRMLAPDLQPGDEIIVTAMEHHANLIPWQMIARERGALVNIAPLRVDASLDLEAFKVLLTPRTKIVAVTWTSNVTGVTNPVAEIIAAAHRVGALVAIDAAQAVGHLAVDVQALDADFLAFSGHKMFGPTGIGVLYGKKALLERLEPVVFGGDMVSEVTLDHATWNELPHKFEAGTPPIAEAIGLGAAVQFIEKITFAAIQAHQHELTTYVRTKLSAIPGLTIYGSGEAGIFSFTVAGIHPHDLATILDRAHIAIRAGHHCAMPLHAILGVPATARVSLHITNTTADIDALCAAIMQAQEIFK